MLTSVNGSDSVKIHLQTQVICPHCWDGFSPATALWISQHSDLAGDPRLGDDQGRRFLPTRFTAHGEAIDSRGMPCAQLACPKCHLEVPRAMFDMPSTFWSILGAPASGKSYFLAAMTWRLRKILPQRFQLSFADVDPLTNRAVNEYEELVFLNPEPQKLVAIRKTELQGDMYDTVLFGDQTVNYPRPLIFSVRTIPGHRHEKDAARLGRVLCLYDNAGEHFLPGQHSVNSPVTQHLAKSRAMFFLFDPMQDPRFRKICSTSSEDPQLRQHARTLRQETILHEAANRVRRFTGLPENEKHNRPLIVIVTKYDAWYKLLDKEKIRKPYVRSEKTRQHALDLPYIARVSAALRSVLWNHVPEVVSAAESFTDEVYYIPVSATGVSPEEDPQTGMLGVRSEEVEPVWAEVPMLFALNQYARGLITSWGEYATNSAIRR